MAITYLDPDCKIRWQIALSLKYMHWNIRKHSGHLIDLSGIGVKVGCVRQLLEGLRAENFLILTLAIHANGYMDEAVFLKDNEAV